MKRILVVEDHPDSRNVILLGLNHAGYEAIGARNAYEALEMANDQPFDLIISDVGLPGYNGIDLLREIHSTYHIPVMSMSGFSAYESGDASREAGCLAHFVKPLDFDRMLDTISQAIEDKMSA